ncbi:16S rRNA methyltransferase [Thioclava sp. SK-1]|uniref:RsmB/NOP family class I SAM-dependent RNA methyltransferase n=1 Tax=Thioclava sp. SK-1 TaxID=1889770 RepID=UPI000825D30F|nr:transcription antitermination factor NusB [Thioclava sp. SK-1]OCX65804.1 16S rRNA methyltransferase [Thioclava sp. SK-1]
MARPDPARRAALALIVGTLEDRESLAEQIAQEALDGLSPPERARAQRLATSVLRHLQDADAMLKPFLKRKPPTDVIALLRLTTVEICVEGVAPYGAVDAAVTLCRSAGQKLSAYSGLVNAVSRKVAEDRARWDTLPAPQLPSWLRGRLNSAYGKVDTQKIEVAHHAGAPVDLTVKSDAADWAERLEGEVLPTGSVRLAHVGQLSKLPGFDSGDWWVQDAGAAMAARALHAQPDEHVLDLCAAPGGKTLQLAQTGAQVTALDISKPRLERLHENLSRCGLSAQVVAADAMHWTPDTQFDAILLDAPCSATGTIRRHPELPLIKDSASIKPLFALQAQMFDRALTWLKPGGRLVYCTCSLLPEEGELQLHAALERNPDLTVLPIDLPGVEPHWQTPQGGLRLRPDYWADRGGMDGFFIATVQRSSI